VTFPLFLVFSFSMLCLGKTVLFYPFRFTQVFKSVF
jgi:hypothetical protein